MGGVAGIVHCSTQILARIAHFDLRDGQIAVRVEIDSRICGDSLTVLVPEHLRLGVALSEALERYRMILKDANVLLTDAEIGRN